MEELIGLMLLGSILGSDFDPVKIADMPDFEKFKAEALAKRKEYQKKAKEFAKQRAETDANNAKMIFDTYLKAGFTQEQALELLKVNLGDSNINTAKKGNGENNG